MPSFLFKVFGRKKDDKEAPPAQGRDSDASLLEGKFEAVSPTVSPTAAKFPETVNNAKEKEKERDFGFTLFKSKSRSASPDPTSLKRAEVPHLSLNLPGPKDESNSRALGVVFEADPDAQVLLPDSIIGERRLNPLETLLLVRACSQAITTRGLESLGIMHPHWYSASPDIQRRLISLFLRSLAPNSSVTTLSPTSTSSPSNFESEMGFTRSPHDVAAVLRWGIRHLQLEGNSFGKDEDWYKNFFEAERSSDYPPTAFSDKLVPQLPPAHVELLTAMLEILSSLAAHAEANSTSGSKLSKLFGLWLLAFPRTEPTDDWASFYSRWERAGRILEHLFLSRIRDEAAGHRMPTRLTELISHYPYNKGTPELDLLPRPRFSTRRYEALFVRIETQYANPNNPRYHPLGLISEAFKAEAGENAGLWENIKKSAMDDSQLSSNGYPTLSHIFADETIRLLSLVPADKDIPSINLFLAEKQPATRKRSFSLNDGDRLVSPTANGHASTSAHMRASTSDAAKMATSPTSPISVSDWAEFSATGFQESSPITPLASTLLDKDVEVTQPQPRKPSKKPKHSGSVGRGRKSLESPASVTTSPVKEVKLVSKVANTSFVPLDEAFIDFWSDALLDPISSDWPPFLICKLKSPLSGPNKQPVDWLLIEQTYTKPPAPSSGDVSTEATRRPRPSSPKPSFKSDISGTLSATRKRFSIFSSGRANPRQSMDKMGKGKKSGKVGEMGEILAEEDEKTAETPKIRVTSLKPKESLDASKKSLDAGKSATEEAKAIGTAAVVAAAEAATSGAPVTSADTTMTPAEVITGSTVKPIEKTGDTTIESPKPAVPEITPSAPVGPPAAAEPHAPEVNSQPDTTIDSASAPTEMEPAANGSIKHSNVVADAAPVDEPIKEVAAELANSSVPTVAAVVPEVPTTEATEAEPTVLEAAVPPEVPDFVTSAEPQRIEPVPELQSPLAPEVQKAAETDPSTEVTTSEIPPVDKVDQPVELPMETSTEKPAQESLVTDVGNVPVSQDTSDATQEPVAPKDVVKEVLLSTQTDSATSSPLEPQQTEVVHVAEIPNANGSADEAPSTLGKEAEKEIPSAQPIDSSQGHNSTPPARVDNGEPKDEVPLTESEPTTMPMSFAEKEEP